MSGNFFDMCHEAFRWKRMQTVNLFLNGLITGSVIFHLFLCDKGHKTTREKGIILCLTCQQFI